MNPYEVFKGLENVKGKAKIAFLKENESVLLKDILFSTFNTMQSYGIKKYEFEEPTEHKEGFGSNFKLAFHLLVKLSSREWTGNTALEAIKRVSAQFTTQQQEVLGMMLDRKLKCGISISTVNAAFEGLIPVFQVQLATAYKDAKYPVIVEPKYDGLRCVVVKIGDEIIYLSRNGKEFHNFSSFDDELRIIGAGYDLMFDGEILGCDNDGAFKAIQKQARRKSNIDVSSLRLQLFDVMKHSEFRNLKCDHGQAERSTLLKVLFKNSEERETFNVRRTPQYIAISYEKALKYYEKCLSQGFEGIVIKDMSAPYLFKRARGWQKIKPTTTEDLIIAGYKEGKGRLKGTLGALIVDREGVEISVGGLTDTIRAKLWAVREELIGKFVEIKYDAVTPDGSLRFPRFIKMRPDKD